MAQNPDPSALDQTQIIQRVFDADNDRLRVDATIEASIGEVTISASNSDIAIEDRVTGNLLKVNADGSIDTNVVVSAAGGDNIAISDGTNTLAVNADGSINSSVTATDLDIRNLDASIDSVTARQATHDDLNANANIQVGNIDVSNANPVPIGDGGSSITVDATDFDIRDLVFDQDSVDVTGSVVTVNSTDLDIRDLKFTQDSVDVTGSLVTEEFSADILAELQSVDGKLPALGPQSQSGSVSVTLATDQPAIPVDVSLDAFVGPNPDNVQLVGSLDGTKAGPKYGFVNNLRLQILDSHDRIAEFTYADFGTKNQRITRIDYSSSTFPGVTVRRVFNYTLVGNNYRRDDEVWTIV